MADIETKTLAQLIDELIITEVKIYHLIDVIHDDPDNDKVAEASRKAQALNLVRSQLVNALDKRLEGKESSIKTR